MGYIGLYGGHTVYDDWGGSEGLAGSCPFSSAQVFTILTSLSLGCC